MDKQWYICDPDKNDQCRKRMCYAKGGSCECTSHPEYAITDSDGNPIKTDVRERLKQKMEKNKLIK